ncbi:uncharacterized protein K460DRAFT_317788 [Cucurbitaria berberidis CBS 394.84]|uniref:RNA-dependent RNA polymerase n=1 Tax=Cucurbitaria berberidis CBS 394.84 TaxID=1168544 RepID=A0A9P4L7I3_9PLEO|nr:uncharacterized protein K460DRAFT_317788 [Cucurbitaria berberidis CBS 394.84]KAF1844339.1 hypothetical protein K460DRAFT_317788 [Cucurbitaria berberidis CBS 394.84]
MSDGSSRGGGTASLPKTPHHLRPGAAIDELIRSLEAEWRIGLKVRGADWSPLRRSTNDQADKIYGQVQHLFYSARVALNQALATFKELAPFWPHEKRLELLSGVLSSKKGDKNTISRTSTPKNDPPKTLKSSLIAAAGQAPQSGSLSRESKHDVPDSYTTAVDPGSPTDVDTDDEFVTPQSPSPSSRSAQSRMQASSFVSLRSTTRKRPSDSSNSSSQSPKWTKTSQGKQALQSPKSGPIPTPPLFKRPSLDMARSLQTAASGLSSVNTSFNDSVSSSQGTTNTANTSFTSYDGTADIRDSKVTRTSLITGSSLNDENIANATTNSGREVFEKENHKRLDRIFSQNLSRESRTTFGSVDEDGLRDMLYKVEGETRPVSALNAKNQDPKGFNVTEDGRGHTSPAKSGLSKKRQMEGMSMDVSPLKESPRPITPAESPRKESHYIRCIPEQNLFVDEVPTDFSGIPYFVLFICQRIAAETSVSLPQLMQDINVASVHSTADAFCTSIRNHSNPKVALQSTQGHSRIWQAAKRQLDGYTFKGRISFNPKSSGQVFSLQLSPIHADKSCRFQRKFGSDRFLYLNAPVFDYLKIDRFNAAEMKQVELRWNEWLVSDHCFLGRIWRVCHVEPLKRGKSSRRATTHDKRVILFATEGWGVDIPYSIGEMLNWFLPFALNKNQTFCKAYARIELGLSRTVSTFGFKPSQIQRIPDTLANGEREDIQFNDPALSWETIPDDQIMNDGCSMMSVGAAREIWRQYKEATGLEGRLPLPSVFQGRIAGAKGLWMISGESSSREPRDTAIWIQISDSQLKFEPHNEDLSDETYDPLRLTFEVSNYSSTPTPSELHISFIPIMIDRGVPQQVIADFTVECLNADRTQLLDVLTNPARTYDWLYRNGSKSSNGSEISWQAGLPVALEEKLRLLLESGFTPMKSSYLARNLERFITTQQILQESSLRTPLGKSTYLFGVADPLGVLKPGEIHLQFSSSFVDELTEDTYLNLRNTDVLVARQPACRRSDIQKVRALVCPELNHLIDVVVFPSRGEYPLAGKLQGGDYDGDIFWLCWEPRLVGPFRNAPAPVQKLDCEQYGIKTHKQKVKDIMDPTDLKEFDTFLRKAFEFRSNPSLLGRVTVYLEKQAYRESKVFSWTLDKLCGLHDLLVDAPKQGYTFTLSNFKHYTEHTLSISEPPKTPAYKAAMKDCSHFKELGDVDKVREAEYPYKPDRVLDYLYFGVVRVHNVETIGRVKELLSKASTADETLIHPYKYLEAKQHRVINEELGLLKDNITRLRDRWASGFKKATTPEQSDVVAVECYREFRALQPTHIDDPEVKPWLEPYSGLNSFVWEDIRASTLYARYPWPEKANFVFKMAGRELVGMKSRSFPNSRCIVAPIHGIMRPKRIKAPIEYAEEEEAEESEDEFTSAVEKITE